MIKNNLKILYISLSVVVVDQISKMMVKGFSIPFLNIYHPGMFEGERVPIFGNFFRLTFIENPGMAFGFDPGVDMKIWVSLFSLFASIGLMIYFYYIRNRTFVLRLAIAFILGGAVGNLIDRMFYGIFYQYAPLFHGRVVDFLDVDFFKFNLLGRSFDRWPIFNIADSAVTIGVLILIFFYRSEKLEDEKEEAPAAESNSANISS